MNSLLLGEDVEQTATSGGLLSYLPAVLWQRRWWIIIPALVSVTAASAAALLIPPVYQASAVMLVRSPQLPDEIIGQMNDSLVERRVAAIREQVTSRPDLVELMDRHGLYADERASEPLADVIEEMRESITLTPSTVDLPSAGVNQRTIAFELAFEYDEAAPAQAVTQDLMDRILDLDASGNLEQATNTAQFLTDQAKDLSEKIAVIEGQIADINARYGGILGGGNGVIMGGSSGSYDVQIAALQRDNANLIAQKNVAGTAETRDPLVLNAESALAAARAVYADNHPDVIIARQRLEEARALARSNNEKLPLNIIDEQIAFNNSQIAALRAAKAREQAQVSAQMSSQARAPLIQQQIDALRQRLSGLNEQYENVQTRLLAARAGVRAEDEQMGQRLTVVEPPIIPEEPIWPDRLLILALGIGGGFGLGVLIAATVELLNRPIRDPKALAAISGVPSLGVVPVIASVGAGFPWKRRRFWRKPALHDGG